MIPTLIFAALIIQTTAQITSQTTSQSPPTPNPNQTPADRIARFEGQVVSSTNGDPLKKATVELRSTTVNRVSSAGNYASTTDAQGKFVFEELQPGTYTLKASRVGYVSQNVLSSGTVSTLKFVAGQKLTDFTIKLTPQGSIYGRITDEDGDPVRDADLALLHWTYETGRKELRPAVQGGINVNDDGTFVAGYLPAGRYYAKATHGISLPAEPGRKGEPQESYVPTYFPSAIDPSGASPIEVSPGIEVRGVEIRLRKARVFRLRGRANVNLAGPVQSLFLRLLARDAPAGQTKSLASDGTFEFINVLPGSYVLEAITTSLTLVTDRVTGEVTRTPPLAGRASINVTDSNVDGVVLTVNSGAEVTGKVKTEDPLTLPATFRVRFQNGNLGFDSDQYKSDGTFRVRGLAPDEYRILVMNLTEGAYIKLVKFGDQDITHKKLDLTSGAPGELEITLSPNAAELAGVVRNEKGDAIADAIVQLTRDDDDAPIPTVSTDQNGAFHIHSLAPGDYRVYAWQDDGDGIIRDPDFRAKFPSQMSKITLIEKSHENLDLKLITKDAMATEAAKLP